MSEVSELSATAEFVKEDSLSSERFVKKCVVGLQLLAGFCFFCAVYARDSDKAMIALVVAGLLCGLYSAIMLNSYMEWELKRSDKKNSRSS